jgi:hypothetical protein
LDQEEGDEFEHDFEQGRGFHDFEQGREFRDSDHGGGDDGDFYDADDREQISRDPGHHSGFDDENRDGSEYTDGHADSPPALRTFASISPDGSAAAAASAATPTRSAMRGSRRSASPGQIAWFDAGAPEREPELALVRNAARTVRDVKDAAEITEVLETADRAAVSATTHHFTIAEMLEFVRHTDPPATDSMFEAIKDEFTRRALVPPDEESLGDLGDLGGGDLGGGGGGTSAGLGEKTGDASPDASSASAAANPAHEHRPVCIPHVARVIAAAHIADTWDGDFRGALVACDRWGSGRITAAETRIVLRSHPDTAALVSPTRVAELVPEGKFAQGGIIIHEFLEFLADQRIR